MEPEVVDLAEFRKNLVMACYNYNERQIKNLYCVAVYCAVTMGIPLASSMAEGIGAIGTVTVPGVGTISGYLLGGLAGMAVGGGACTIYSKSIPKAELDKIANSLVNEDELKKRKR